MSDRKNRENAVKQQESSGIFAEIDARDVIAVIGLVLLSAGFYQIYWPAALIVPGGILCWYAFVLLRQSSSDRNGPTE